MTSARSCRSWGASLARILGEPYTRRVALPDYPSLKRDISECLIQVMTVARDQRLGPFNRASHVTFHEGEASDFSTVDGEIQELELRPLEVSLVVTQSEFPDMSHEEVLQKMVELGVQFGDQMIQSFITNLDKVTQETGNVVNAAGRPLDAGLLYELYESVEISFDDDGNPNLPQLIGGTPQQREVVRRTMTEDEDFRSRFAALIAQKREYWLARQSDRKLVD